MKNIIFILIVTFFFSNCTEEITPKKQLVGEWVEQTPINNRTELVVTANGLIEVIKNQSNVFSFTLIEIREDSIELSDNNADTKSNLIKSFNFQNNDSFTIGDVYSNSNVTMSFKRQ